MLCLLGFSPPSSSSLSRLPVPRSAAASQNAKVFGFSLQGSPDGSVMIRPVIVSQRFLAEGQDVVRVGDDIANGRVEWFWRWHHKLLTSRSVGLGEPHAALALVVPRDR